MRLFGFDLSNVSQVKTASLIAEVLNSTKTLFSFFGVLVNPFQTIP